MIYISSIIQAVTEFLPISSTAHLIIFDKLSGIKSPYGIIILLHFATLISVVAYNYKILYELLINFFSSSVFQLNIKTNFVFKVGCATIPVLLLGFFLSNYLDLLESIILIASANLIASFILLYADKVYKNKVRINDIYLLSYPKSFLIGTFQAFALIPGVSRSGITISAGLFVGLDKKQSIIFSLFLSIPIITVSIFYLFFQAYNSNSLGLESFELKEIIISFLITSILAYLSIPFLIKLVNKLGFTPFVIYRICLSLFLFGFIFYY